MRLPRWLLFPALLLFLSGVLVPMIIVLRMSLYARGDIKGERQYETLFYQPGTWALESYSRIFTQSYYLHLFAFTAFLAVTVSVITLVLGYLIAYRIYRSGPKEKLLLVLAVILPKFTNILVFVFGVKMIFGANGLLPVIAGEVLLLVPYAALTIAAGLEAVPYHLVEAARGLGASPRAAFFRITLPLSMPGLSAAAVLTLLWSVSAFLGPYLLGQPAQTTVAVEIDRQVHQDLNWTLAAALNIVLIGVLAATAYAMSVVRRRLS